MRPGEDSVVTLTMVRDPSRATTNADDIELNDIARSHAYKRRLAEEKSNRLEAELDEAQRQIHALHAELRRLTDRYAEEAERSSAARVEMEQRCDSLQQLVDHLQEQRARMTHVESLSVNRPSSNSRLLHGDSGTVSPNRSRRDNPERRATTQPVVSPAAARTATKPSVQTVRRLEEELTQLQHSTFAGSREPRAQPKELEESLVSSSIRSSHRPTVQAVRQEPPAFVIHVVYVDEGSQIEKALGDVVHPGPAPLAVAQMMSLIRMPPDISTSVLDCTLCLLRGDGSGHVVVEHNDTRTLVKNNDTLYIAKMAASD